MNTMYGIHEKTLGMNARGRKEGEREGSIYKEEGDEGGEGWREEAMGFYSFCYFLLFLFCIY